MFLLKRQGLPKDPVFPANLDALGYKINSKDEIVDKYHPTDYYRFYWNKNQRYNEVRCEAFHDAIRKEVLSRLAKLDIHRLYLPQLSFTKPVQEANVPILCTSLEELKKKDVIVFINNGDQEDLGILSWRTVAKEGGVSAGSVVSIIDEIIKRCEGREDSSTPGFIVLNPGQRLYSYKKGEAVSLQTWDAMPRQSAAHDDPWASEENFVSGHGKPYEHLSSVFESVVDNANFVDPKAQILAIGLRGGGSQLAQYFDQNWSKYSSNRLLALALTQPNPISPENHDFQAFLRNRTKAWMLTTHPLGTPLANHDENGFPVVSGGEVKWDEAIITTAHKEILTWFEEVYSDVLRNGDYKHPEMEIPDDEILARQAVPVWEGDAEYDGATTENGSTEDAVKDAGFEVVVE